MPFSSPTVISPLSLPVYSRAAFFKNGVFEVAHRIGGKRFYLRCRREQLFEIAREVANNSAASSTPNTATAIDQRAIFLTLPGFFLFLFSLSWAARAQLLPFRSSGAARHLQSFRCLKAARCTAYHRNTHRSDTCISSGAKILPI